MLCYNITILHVKEFWMRSMRKSVPGRNHTSMLIIPAAALFLFSYAWEMLAGKA